MTNPRPSLFGIDTFQDILDKAEREFKRAQSAPTSIDRTDHLINCCITLGQATEYKWHEIKSKPAGTGLRGSNDLRSRIRKLSSSVAVVENVNLVAKHVNMNHPQEAGDYTAMPILMLSGTPGMSGTDHVRRNDGVSLSLLNEVAAAIQFWKAFDDQAELADVS